MTAHLFARTSSELREYVRGNMPRSSQQVRLPLPSPTKPNPTTTPLAHHSTPSSANATGARTRPTSPATGIRSQLLLDGGMDGQPLEKPMTSAGCATGKQRFASHRDANLALLRRWRKCRPGHNLECRTYRCSMCGSWHLTSQAKRPSVTP